MSERQMTFSIHELNLIHEDQKNLLENFHLGEICTAVQDCPRNHEENPKRR